MTRKLLRTLRRDNPQLRELVIEASRRTGAPFTFISIACDTALTHVARHGLELCDVDVRISFHRHVGERGLCIRDAMSDWRFRYHPLVQAEPKLRSYIAQPIVINGCVIGSISAASPIVAVFDDDDLAAFAVYALAAQSIIDALREARSP